MSHAYLTIAALIGAYIAMVNSEAPVVNLLTTTPVITNPPPSAGTIVLTTTPVITNPPPSAGTIVLTTTPVITNPPPSAVSVLTTTPVITNPPPSADTIVLTTTPVITNPPPSAGTIEPATTPSTTLAAVNGGWTRWSRWGRCSKTCAGGIRIRSHTCTNPAPSGGGAGCPGPSSETQACPCTAVNGGWSRWGRWSRCSVTCGGGTRTRTRSCTRPRPRCCGAPCRGLSRQTNRCSLQMCRAAQGQCITSRFVARCGGFGRTIMQAQALRLLGTNPRNNICQIAQAWWNCLSRYNQHCSAKLKAGHRALIGAYDNSYRCGIRYTR